MKFEWDETKNQLNKKKHGIDFETAMLVFNDLQRIEIYDAEHSITEEQIRSIREAVKREIVFDEDSPEMTPKMEEAFRIAARKRNINRKMDVS